MKKIINFIKVTNFASFIAEGTSGAKDIYDVLKNTIFNEGNIYVIAGAHDKSVTLYTRGIREGFVSKEIFLKQCKRDDVVIVLDDQTLSQFQFSPEDDYIPVVGFLKLPNKSDIVKSFDILYLNDDTILSNMYREFNLLEVIYDQAFKTSNEVLVVRSLSEKTNTFEVFDKTREVPLLRWDDLKLRINNGALVIAVDWHALTVLLDSTGDLDMSHTRRTYLMN